MKGQGGQPDLQCTITIFLVSQHQPGHPLTQTRTNQVYPASVPCSHNSLICGTLLPFSHSQLSQVRSLLKPAHQGGFLSEGKLHTPAPTQLYGRSLADVSPPRLEHPTFSTHNRAAGHLDSVTTWACGDPPHVCTGGQSLALTCVSPASGSARGR